MLIERKGNLLESDAQYIVHQSNCVTNKAKHLAESVFNAFPYANIYKPRLQGNYRDKPGTIIVRGNGTDKRFVIALLGQYYPGSSKYNNDSYEKRFAWFTQGLDEIGKIPGLKSIAFPARIGCGAAGGNWDDYYNAIKDFAKLYPHVIVEIITL